MAACELQLVNHTPASMFQRADKQYPINVTLTPARSERFCTFYDERVLAVVNGTPHYMTRIHPNSTDWIYVHTETASHFNFYCQARYRSRYVWFVTAAGQARFPQNGTFRVDLVPLSQPQVHMEPPQLYFYFDADVPNTDQTTSLQNPTVQTVFVQTASIQAATSGLGSAGGQAFFTLISPTNFNFAIPVGGQQDFVVRFANSTQQRAAQLVINTDRGIFTVPLSGKYFLW